jgi:hypothetical protein
MKHFFLNLTSCVLNKLHVVEIVKRPPNKYRIYMSNSKLSGFTIFGAGGLNTECNVIEICEKENKEDYIKITDWIRTIGTDYEK